MEEFYREVGISSSVGCNLLGEARTFGLTLGTPQNDSYKLSQAIPGSSPAKEFKKLPQEVKEVIREKIVQDPSLVLTIKDLKEENERLAKDALDGRRIAAQVDELQSQLNAVTNNEATTLAEAKRELDFTLQEFMSWQRKIDSLSNNLFTHNDPNTITQLESVLTVILQSFIRRKEQFIQGSSTESAIECTVSRI
jgi:DNA gyrase/topoisomerase IV subunit B